MIYKQTMAFYCLLALHCTVDVGSTHTNQAEKITRKIDSDRLLRTRSVEDSEDINTISVTRINILMDDHNYERRLQFRSFNTLFDLFLRRYSVFNKDVVLSIDSRVISERSTMRKYTPACYRGYMNSSSLSHISVTITYNKFEAYIQVGNLTYCVQCPNRAEHLYDFKQLLYPLTKCSIQKWSVLNNFLDSKTGIPQSKGQNSIPIFKDVDRSKRVVQSVPITGNCVLKIIVDHLYFESVGNSDISQTIAEISISVAEADLILRSTDFDGDGIGDNIGLKIGNITIYKSQSDYKMKNDGRDPYAYLNHLSEYDHSRYCLAVAFTYRNFKDKIAGLAWIATSNKHGAFGGICQHFAWELRELSTNSILVSQICLGRRVSAAVVGLILVHEVGHSMGSKHDELDDSICSPGGNFGNYIMYPKILDGNRANHRRFSSCSISSMYPVLVERAPTCFQHDTVPVCGNMLLEDGEECDCGTASTCAERDPCCTPTDVPSSSSDAPCTVRKSLGYQCSTYTSECCSGACMYVSSEDGVHCRKETECSKKSICESGSPSCPDSQIFPNGKQCDSGRKICVNGTCSASICQILGLQECLCSSTLLHACLICCIPTNGMGVCSLLNTYDNELNNVLKHRGGPCLNYRGFCTESGHCLLYEANPYDILHQYFDEDTVEHISDWIKKYWYFVLVGSFATALIAVVLSHFFKQKPTTTTDALRVGKLAGVLTLAEAQKMLYKDGIEECEALFQAIAQDVKTKPRKKTITDAVMRLSVLFPTAPKPLIVRTALSCSTEEVAVKMLLLRNFPIKPFVISPVYANIFE